MRAGKTELGFGPHHLKVLAHPRALEQHVRAAATQPAAPPHAASIDTRPRAQLDDLSRRRRGKGLLRSSSSVSESTDMCTGLTGGSAAISSGVLSPEQAGEPALAARRPPPAAPPSRRGR